MVSPASPASSANAIKVRRPRIVAALCAAAALLAAGYLGATRINSNLNHAAGDQLDQFNGVVVYYNGAINHTEGRNTTADGYNLGLRYQCVEFVKRYYYERFAHKMPDSMGHAKEFFSASVADGALNPARNLLQFRNGGSAAPAPEDLVVFAPWLFNRYGHVAIVSAVGDDFIEVIQQNAGPFGAARERFPLVRDGAQYRVGHERMLGWLRRAPPPVAQASAATP